MPVALFALCFVVLGVLSVTGVSETPGQRTACGPNGTCLCQPQIMNCSAAGLTTLTFLNDPQLGDLTVLDVSHNNIATLPAGIFDYLLQLQTLDLSSNAIRCFPPGVFELLTGLQSLSLDGNLISALSRGSFATLAQLSVLTLDNNNALGASLLAGVFDGLTGLRTLSLSACGVAVFDGTIFSSLKLLEILDVSHNLVTDLSVGLFDGLANLTALYMSYNALSNLPSDIFRGLANLQSLSLDNNGLQNLPASIFAPLSQLQHLYLFSNAFTDLSSSIFSALDSLTVLELGFNFISALPTGIFALLPHLQFLSLHNNELSQLTLGIFNGLSNLQQLWLFNNSIRDLSPGIFDDLDNLTDLELSANLISTLRPNIFSNLGRLQTLYLSNNGLVQLPPDAFVGLHALRSLFLGNHLTFRCADLSALPGGIFDDLESLQVLSLPNIGLRDITPGMFDSLVNLQQLWLYSNRVATLPLGIFDQLRSLQLLDLRNNSISDLPPRIFDKLLSLVNLWLMSNHIYALPAGIFDSLGNLLVLDLDSNRISTLPSGIFDSITSVTVMYVSNNALADLPERVFDHLASLEYLFLMGNQLASFNADVFVALSNLQYLFLQNNCLAGALSEQLFSNLQRLRILDLGQNKLRVIPTLPASLGSVFLTGNNLQNPGQVQAQLALNESLFFVVVLSDNPVVCAPSYTIDGVSGQLDFGVRCGCSAAFALSEDTLCVQPAIAFPLVVLLSAVFGGVAGGVMLCGGATWVVRRMQRLRASNDERAWLLWEQHEELDELKRGWAIAAAEVVLLRRIDQGSEGAFGEVWLAEWDGLQVAVKRLRATVVRLDSGALLDFDREVSFLRKCRHRNVVRFFGAGMWSDAMPFLVTEFMPVGGLGAYLRDAPSPISWACKMSMCVDVQAGMQYIHTLNRMHRDLKSDNVLLSDRLRAKVADFGSMNNILRLSTDPALQSAPHAARHSQRVTAEGASLTTFVGTPLYMAPEVLRGAACGPSADVWSFGVLLWEIATQQRPDLASCSPPEVVWRGPYMMALARALADGHRLPLDPAQCPPDYAATVSRCLTFKPSGRPTFGELGDMLTHIADRVVGSVS